MNIVYFYRFCISYSCRCLLIGRVQYLYTIDHAVENIKYYNKPSKGNSEGSFNGTL